MEQINTENEVHIILGGLDIILWKEITGCEQSFRIICKL